MTGLVFNIQKFSLHDGAGIRTSVFFQGCNLRCKWCSNPESFAQNPQRPDCEARPYTVEALVAELAKDKVFYDASGGGVTLTGGEPLLQPDFACALCDALKAAGIGVWMETAANVPPEPFLAVLQKCEAVHIDLKHWDEAAHLSGTGVGLGLILGNIRASVRSGVRTIIRIPVIPGFNDSPGDIRRFAALLAELGVREVQLLPFHQMGAHKYEKLGIAYAYQNAQGLRDAHLEPLAALMRAAGVEVQIGG